MATGQDIVNVKQYLTFYDVTGLIDSEKRYYYVPHKEEMAIGQQTCLAFLSCLNNVCPPPISDFVDIEISRWNPNDRELVVKANIDVFTKGSSSHVLNYLIVKRELYFLIKPSTYYDAFFIRSATQTGMGSVRLSLESDDFTNTFYLHNNNVVVAGEEPFNDLIKNAFIERQHYDRFSVTETKSIFSYSVLPDRKLEVGKKYKINKINSGNININVNKRIKLYRTTSTKDYEYLGEHEDFKFNTDNDTMSFGSEHVVISGYINESYFYFIEVLEEYETENAKIIFVFEVVSQTITRSYARTNVELFTKTKETFSYRKQKKTEHFPVVIYKDVTSLGYESTYMEEIPESAFGIVTTSDVEEYLSSLSDRERKSVVSAVVKYMHILARDKITYPTRMYVSPDTTFQNEKTIRAWYGVEKESESVPSAQQHLVIPFIAKVKGLEAFYEYFKDRIYLYTIPNYLTDHADSETEVLVKTFTELDFTNLISKLEEMFGYYIQSMYVTPYSCLSKKMSVDLVSNTSPSYAVCFRSVLFQKGTNLSPEEYPITELSDNSSKDVNTYSDVCVEQVVMSFIPEEIPEIEYPYQTQSVTGNQFLDGLISALDYYQATWNRKSLKSDVKFKSVPYAVCNMHVDGLVDGTTRKSTQTSFTMLLSHMFSPIFIVGDNIFDEYVTELNDSIKISDIPSMFYDPILDLEPYTLNTYSFLQIESPVQKKRMAENYSSYTSSGYIVTLYPYQLKYNQVVNNQYKLGLIPSYYEENMYHRNYNDALIFISSDGLTIRNNSYYDYTYQQQARMSTERFLVSLKGGVDLGKYVAHDMPYNIGSGALMGGWKGAIEGAGRSLRDVQNMTTDYIVSEYTTKLMQETELAGAGAKADEYASAGTNIMFDINNNEFMIYRNKYKIDELSYNSTCKYLERYGYRVDIYDKLNVQTRKGWDYVKLVSFDICETNLKLSVSQEETLNEVFRSGVTLIHDLSYINEEKHNIEVGIDEE